MDQQSYLTFTNTLLQGVDITADTSAFEVTLQNTINNGTGELAYASSTFGAGMPPGSDFRVAQITLLPTAPGTATLHWQYARPRRVRATARSPMPVVRRYSNPALYVDVTVQIVAANTRDADGDEHADNHANADEHAKQHADSDQHATHTPPTPTNTPTNTPHADQHADGHPDADEHAKQYTHADQHADDHANATNTPTNTPTATNTPSDTPTATNTPTDTPTTIGTATSTSTPTASPTCGPAPWTQVAAYPIPVSLGA